MAEVATLVKIQILKNVPPFYWKLEEKQSMAEIVKILMVVSKNWYQLKHVGCVAFIRFDNDPPSQMGIFKQKSRLTGIYRGGGGGGVTCS